MHARIRWAVSGAIVAFAVAAAAVGGSPAVATDGEPILAGSLNTQTRTTLITNTDHPAPGCPTAATGGGGLTGCGQTGVSGVGSVYGVTAVGPNVAVYAESAATGVRGFGETIGVEGVSATGTGVEGFNNGTTGIGVHGHTGGTGSGVYGQATSNGAGVFGDSSNGTGVQARSTNGNALRVLGRAEFSRSGIAVVTGTPGAPRASVMLSNVALTAKSLVLVTPQRIVQDVYVLGVERRVSAGTVMIRLNQPVTVNYPIAWFIVETP